MNVKAAEQTGCIASTDPTAAFSYAVAFSYAAAFSYVVAFSYAAASDIRCIPEYPQPSVRTARTFPSMLPGQH